MSLIAVRRVVEKQSPEKVLVYGRARSAGQRSPAEPMCLKLRWVRLSLAQ